jgi:hypothetical protein
MYVYLAPRTPWHHKVRRWLLVTTYFIAYLCHLISTSTDERMAIMYDRSPTWYTNATLVELTLGDELTDYYNLNIARLACLSLGWILACTLYAPTPSPSTSTSAEKSPLMNKDKDTSSTTRDPAGGSSGAVNNYPTSYDRTRPDTGPPARDNADTARTLTFAPGTHGNRGGGDIELGSMRNAGGTATLGSGGGGGLGGTTNFGATGTLGWGSGTGANTLAAAGAGGGLDSMRATGARSVTTSMSASRA